MQCSLMPPHRDGFCDWCGIRLEGKRRRWCSDDCTQEFRRQHDWETAREAVLVRDGYACQRCKVLTVGRFPSDWEALPSAPSRPQWEDFDDPHAFQTAMETWKAAWKLFTVRVVKPLMPEVNHKEPLVGKGYSWGCCHHAENLETLCHRCHVQTTKQQRMDRRMENARKVYVKERARVLEQADRTVSNTVAERRPGSIPGVGTPEQEAQDGRRSRSGTRQEDGAATGQNGHDAVVSEGTEGLGYDAEGLTGGR